MQKRFTNKTVWVSGAAQGIGKSIADYFAEEGASVAVIDIKEQEGREAVECIKAKGGKAAFFFL